MVGAVLGLYTPSWCWYRCPEIGASSIDWAQLSRFYLKTETKRTVFLDKDRTMDNDQQHNIVLMYHRHKLLDLI
jgi:hypothetical protein